jgi:hypothetical protein
MPAAQRGWQALDASGHPSAMQNSLPGHHHQLDAAVTCSTSLSFQRQQPRAQLGQEYMESKRSKSLDPTGALAGPTAGRFVCGFAVMKSHSHDKSSHVGSCAAQLSSRVLLKKLAFASLPPPSLPLYASLLRPVWLAACLALPAWSPALHASCLPSFPSPKCCLKHNWEHRF